MPELKRKKNSESRVQEPLYSYEDLVNACSTFKVKPEVIAGALKLIRKQQVTKAEAEEAIRKFLERKVK